MRSVLLGAACLLAAAAALAADTWTLFNPSGLPYQQELVRLRLDVPADIAPARHAVLDGDTEVPYTVQVVKRGPEVRFSINDLLIYRFVDGGDRYGPLLAGGKIGFSQMAPLIAEYADLTVHRLDI
jgi:hypothetical protein